MVDTEPNDCGIKPFTFRGWVKAACAFHDQAYIKDSWHQQNMTRIELDRWFLTQMLEISGRNILKIGASYLMYGVTRVFGGRWWEGKI